MDDFNAQEKTLKIVVFVSALFLRAGTTQLFNLIMAIQIISYLPLYKVDLSAELELYLNSLRSIADLDML